MTSLLQTIVGKIPITMCSLGITIWYFSKMIKSTKMLKKIISFFLILLSIIEVYFPINFHTFLPSKNSNNRTNPQILKQFTKTIRVDINNLFIILYRQENGFCLHNKFGLTYLWIEKYGGFTTTLGNKETTITAYDTSGNTLAIGQNLIQNKQMINKITILYPNNNGSLSKFDIPHKANDIITKIKIIDRNNMAVLEASGKLTIHKYIIQKNSIKYLNNMSMNIKNHSIITNSKIAPIIVGDYMYFPVKNDEISIINWVEGIVIGSIDLKMQSPYNSILHMAQYKDYLLILTDRALVVVDHYLKRVVDVVDNINPTSNFLVINNYLYFHDNKFLMRIPTNNFHGIEKIQLKHPKKLMGLSDIGVIDNHIIIFVEDGSTLLWNIKHLFSNNNVQYRPSKISRISSVPPFMLKDSVIYIKNFSYGSQFNILKLKDL